MKWTVAGHQRQLKFLENVLAEDHLAHGYLFAGPEGVGKRTIALELSAELLNTEIKENFFHPDFFEIDGKDGIKIEQIRELTYKLSLRPYSAKYKVAIIDHAEEMTLEAANALLKSLEEPKSYTVIILITSNPNKLPKTILSRVQKINFGLVPGQEITPRSEDNFEIFSNKDLPERLILASNIAEKETEEIKDILISWLLRLSKELRSKPTIKIKNKIDQINQALKGLEMNSNSKLLMTNLILNT